MTGRPRPRPAADTGILRLLTASEVALELPGRCPVDRVARLADAGEIVRVWLGSHARYTPESVAAYKARLAGAAEAARAS